MWQSCDSYGGVDSSLQGWSCVTRWVSRYSIKLLFDNEFDLITCSTSSHGRICQCCDVYPVSFECLLCFADFPQHDESSRTGNESVANALGAVVGARDSSCGAANSLRRQSRQREYLATRTAYCFKKCHSEQYEVSFFSRTTLIVDAVMLRLAELFSVDNSMDKMHFHPRKHFGD